MLSSLPVSPPEIPYPIFPPTASMKVLPNPPTHSLLPSCPGIPLHWGIKPSQDQGPLLSLMSNKAILCYICGWSHGSLHVYSFVGAGLRLSCPGSSLKLKKKREPRRVEK